MSERLIRLPKYHQAQSEIYRNLKRFNVLDCGRRFGKDVLGRNYICKGMLQREPTAWYEPEYKSLVENWDWFVETLQSITTDKSEVERRLKIITGGTLEMWSLQDKDASRGRHYKRIVINEAPKAPHLEYSWNAVIRITLADLLGTALIEGTPRGRDFYWQLFNKAEDPFEVDWAHFQKTTWDNPYIPRQEIEEMKRTLPELIYRQEIMAEFIDDQGGVFRRIQEAARLMPLDSPIADHQYAAGVDVASAIDYTVVSILDIGTKEMVYMDRFNRVDYNVLIDRLDAIYKRWDLQMMKVEANSIGQPVIDQLYSRGLSIIPFMTTNATKQVIIQNLQAGFEHGELAIINNPILIGELLSFESKRNASGSFSYSAPEGMHDDCVMSLALAWDCTNPGGWWFT